MKKTAVLLYLLLFPVLTIRGTARGTDLYKQWPQGPSSDPNYFPIGVWLQSPSDASTYLQAGVNVYIGLWQGPTETQLNSLAAAGMQTICTPNDIAMEYRNFTLNNGRPLIIGYLQIDEPDNCRWNPLGYYDPPISTTVVQDEYQTLKSIDPNRPVFLNLGQGIGHDSGTWTGQGGYIVPDRDYPEYILGSDIISFDIYPMDCSRTQTCGDAWRVALGIDRLHAYAPAGHIVWNFVETSDICANGMQATLEEIRAEVWMSIIHGSKGITYFIHGKTSVSDFDPRAILRPENAERLAGFTQINNQVHSLAAVIHSTTRNDLVRIETIEGDNPVDFAAKVDQNATYILAVGMREGQAVKQFQLRSVPDLPVEVLGEGRTLSLTNGSFTDTFSGYQAHLYKLNAVCISGDLDRDQDVDGEDLSRLSACWMTQEGYQTWDWNADLDPSSSQINLDDLTLFIKNWLVNK